MKVSRHVYLANPLDLLKLDLDNASHLLDQLSLSDSDRMTEYGWVLVGEAAVEFNFTKTHAELVRDSLLGAKKKLEEADAAYQRNRQVILDQISKLQSLGWSGERQ